MQWHKKIPIKRYSDHTLVLKVLMVLKGNFMFMALLLKVLAKLAMTSKYQEIDLGIIGTAELQKYWESG
ncbi:hypothetical protein BHE89_10275 [Shigella sp. FC1967]|nr:hypothetical protein BHE89_10275 [Shigella sp. FC1967]